LSLGGIRNTGLGAAVPERLECFGVEFQPPNFGGSLPEGGKHKGTGEGQVKRPRRPSGKGRGRTKGSWKTLFALLRGFGKESSLKPVSSGVGKQAQSNHRG